MVRPDISLKAAFIFKFQLRYPLSSPSFPGLRFPQACLDWTVARSGLSTLAADQELVCLLLRPLNLPHRWTETRQCTPGDGVHSNPRSGLMN